MQINSRKRPQSIHGLESARNLSDSSPSVQPVRVHSNTRFSCFRSNRLKTITLRRFIANKKRTQVVKQTTYVSATFWNHPFCTKNAAVLGGASSRPRRQTSEGGRFPASSGNSLGHVALRSRQRMTGKPLKHDAVCLLGHLFEDGVTTTRHDDKF